MNSIIADLRCFLPRPYTYYLEGGCLFFAKKLQAITGGNLRYLKNESHVVLEKDGKLYDVRGNVTSIYQNSSYLTETEFLSREKLVSQLTHIQVPA